MAKRPKAHDAENDQGEIPFPAAHFDQVVAASEQKRSSPEESCEIDTDDTGGERPARRACLALVEQMVLQLHRTPVEEESNATHDDPFVDPELTILEEDWVNHKMDEGNFGPILIAAPKREEW